MIGSISSSDNIGSSLMLRARSLYELSRVTSLERLHEGQPARASK
jgi:hypothetical protein